jgi:hypothetical protein
LFGPIFVSAIAAPVRAGSWSTISQSDDAPGVTTVRVTGIVFGDPSAPVAVTVIAAV